MKAKKVKSFADTRMKVTGARRDILQHHALSLPPQFVLYVRRANSSSATKEISWDTHRNYKLQIFSTRIESVLQRQRTTIIDHEESLIGSEGTTKERILGRREKSSRVRMYTRVFDETGKNYSFILLRWSHTRNSNHLSLTTIHWRDCGGLRSVFFTSPRVVIPGTSDTFCSEFDDCEMPSARQATLSWAN